MFKPRRHKVAVFPFYDPDYYNPLTKNIIIPDSAKERSDQGIVKYLGADVSDDIKVGDHVIFSGYTGTTIGIDDEILVEIHQDFIKGKIIDDVDETVTGLYFKGKVDYNYLVGVIEEILQPNYMLPRSKMMAAIDKVLAEVIIPAPYKEAARFLHLAHEEIHQRVQIKADKEKSQRDPIDERNR